MKATCDKCNHLTKITFKEANHPLGVIETYFTCEHCEERYTCFVTDKGVSKKETKESSRVENVT